MKIWMSTLMLILVPLAEAHDEHSVEISQLYDARSTRPGALIPLRVSGATPVSGSVISAVPLSTLAVDCRLMADPFVTEIYHLKCNEEATVHVMIRVSVHGQLRDINFGPLKVEHPDANLIEIDPTSDPAAQDRKAGKALYSSYCAGCHMDPNAKAGRSRQTIKSAILGQLPNTNSMKNTPALQTLTDEQLRVITVYLQKP